jgi:hypothetical protein
MAVSRELWVSNLIGIAKDLGDEEHQRSRWLASDAAAWERPAELLCVLVDDCQFELFVAQEETAMSPEQKNAAVALLERSLKYDTGPDGWRDPQEVLNDPAWKDLQDSARAFVSVFQKEQ